MEENRTSPALEIRKLRKKLRQIDNLERICATRPLTEEESIKVSKKEEIRESLKAFLEQNEINGHSEGDDTKVNDNTNQVNGQEQVEKEGREEDQEKESEKYVLLEKSEGEEDCPVGSEVDEIVTTSETTNSATAPIEQAVGEGDVKTKGKKSKKRSPSRTKEWSKRNFLINVLEGHHHPVCSVDVKNGLIMSGGYDSTVRVWDAKTGEERYSLGGHSGCVTTVVLLDWQKDEANQFGASGSLDCSVKVWNVTEGTMIKSIYVFSPVRSMAYGCDVLAVGNEGGKMQLVNLDTNATVFSENCHDDAITCVKFLPENRVATGSEDGEIKVFSFENDKLQELFSTEDGIRTVSPNNADVSMESADSENPALRLRKINCLEVFEQKLIWGDDGYNLKALDWDSGNVSKFRNNLSEFCPTEALAILSSGNQNYLFSSGFDLDNGNSYINVRNLPDLDYVGTISTPSLGHINALKAFEDEGKIILVTGGSELKVWHEVTRKLKRPADAADDLIPCKYNCSYNTPRESEDDDEDEDDSDGNLPSQNSEEPDDENKEITSRGGWCVIS